LRADGAVKRGDCWIEMTDGGTLTFGQADTEVTCVAGFLAGLVIGIRAE
jgi:hypothetical protein